MTIVNGTSEADVLLGTDSNDQLYGLESDDVLLASTGSDELDGGDGFDTAIYYAIPSGINVELADGATTVTGPDGKLDTLISVEKIVGTFSNDTFSNSVAGVTLEGSSGDDVYIVSAEDVTIVEEDWGGYDELRTSLNSIKMAGFVEKLTFTGTGDFKAYGSDTDNEIIAGAGNDWLWGGDGADHFFGETVTTPSATATALKGCESKTSPTTTARPSPMAICSPASRRFRARASMM